MKDSTEKIIVIATLGVAVLTFSVSIFMLMATNDNNENTGKILEGIEDLVESNTKQIESLNQTIAVIEQQTVLSLYNSARSFTIDFQCSDNNKTDEDDNILAYGFHLRPIVLTADGGESPVSLRIFADLEFYGKENKREGLERYDFDEYSLDPYIWDINNISEPVWVDFTPYFDQAEDKGFKFVHVAYEYDYRLVNPADDYSGFGNQQDGKTIPMVLFELHDNGKWHVVDFEEQYPCRS